MKTKEAKNRAMEWMEKKAPEINGLIGAVLGGSANVMNDDEPWPASSDLDIWIMVTPEGMKDSINLDKVLHKGVILEVTCKNFEYYDAPEKLLSSPFEGYHFAKPGCVLLDTDNAIGNLVATVARRFAEPEWVRARLAGCRGNAIGKLQWTMSLPPGSYFDKLFGFILGIKNISTLPVIAALKHPTVRRALAVSHDVLTEYGRLDFHERILALCGAEKVDVRQATKAAHDLVPAFQRAAEVVKTPFFSSGSIKQDVIPLYLQGADDMIRNGYPREAMYHVIFYYWRVYQALAHDAPESERPFWIEEQQAAFAEWGLADSASVDLRAKAGLELMEQADAICLEIMKRTGKS
jgi:hypothetical protein